MVSRHIDRSGFLIAKFGSGFRSFCLIPWSTMKLCIYVPDVIFHKSDTSSWFITSKTTLNVLFATLEHFLHKLPVEIGQEELLLMRQMRANRKLPSDENINISTWLGALVNVISGGRVISKLLVMDESRIGSVSHTVGNLKSPWHSVDVWPFTYSLELIKAEIAVFERIRYSEKKPKLLLQFLLENSLNSLRTFFPIWLYFLLSIIDS